MRLNVINHGKAIRHEIVRLKEKMAFREPAKYSLDLVEDFVDSVISAQEFFGGTAQHDVHTRRLLYALYKESRAGRGGVPGQYLPIGACSRSGEFHGSRWPHPCQ